MNVVAGLTFVSRVHPLSQQEAAELFLSQFSILDFHQVRSHTERVVLKVPFTLFTATATHTNTPLKYFIIVSEYQLNN